MVQVYIHGFRVPLFDQLDRGQDVAVAGGLQKADVGGASIDQVEALARALVPRVAAQTLDHLLYAHGAFAHTRQRRVGLEGGGRRLDTWNQRRPVRRKDEQEEAADKPPIRSRFDEHRLSDLRIDGADHCLQRGLQAR